MANTFYHAYKVRGPLFWKGSGLSFWTTAFLFFFRRKDLQFLEERQCSRGWDTFLYCHESSAPLTLKECHIGTNVSKLCCEITKEKKINRKFSTIAHQQAAKKQNATRKDIQTSYNQVKMSDLHMNVIFIRRQESLQTILNSLIEFWSSNIL